MAAPHILDDLTERGLVADTTDIAALRSRLDEGPVTLYCGFDPTAPSLHIGNLQSLLLLRRFQDAGHRPVALAGGATGMIGDPSGRDSERTLLDDDTLAANVASITSQLEAFLDFDSSPATSARVVDNRSWTQQMGVLDFLRDVGKHVTVNTMLNKESVRARLDRDSGISFTEFSYMLLQANDFFELHRTLGCELQVAGSDQWGNITAGIDLIRRRSAATVHGLTAPLITSSDGKKFGKSTGGGGLWLDPALTSPYQLFQYFMATDDRDIASWACRLTLEEPEVIAAEVEAHSEAPHLRSGQRFLAGSVVELVHGAQAAATAREVTHILFGGSPSESGEATFEELRAEIPFSALPAADLDDIDVVALCADAFGVSRGAVRKNLAGYYVNGVSAAADSAFPPPALHGRFLLLRKGKRDYHLIETLA